MIVHYLFQRSPTERLRPWNLDLKIMLELVAHFVMVYRPVESGADPRFSLRFPGISSRAILGVDYGLQLSNSHKLESSGALHHSVIFCLKATFDLKIIDYRWALNTSIDDEPVYEVYPFCNVSFIDRVRDVNSSWNVIFPLKWNGRTKNAFIEWPRHI